MISVDGLVPYYYVAPAQFGLKVPNLVRMKLEGAYADGVEGIYPSVTYPAHTTLVSGVRPAKHGIVQNRIFEAPTEPQTRDWYFFSKDLKSETLWTLSKKAGLVTAGVGWPVTVGAELDQNVPEIFDPKESPPSPRRSLQYVTPGLIAKAAGSIPADDTTTDGRRTAMAEFMIKTYKPNLLLVHLVELDSAHHRFGPYTPEAAPVAERLDGYIGRIVEATRAAGIFEKTTFFIVSDHGFASVEKKFEPNVVLVKEKLITLDSSGKPTDWKAAAWPAGGSCAIVLRDPADKETAAKVAQVFERYRMSEGKPINRVLNRTEVERMGAIPQAELMLDASPGFAFDEAFTGPEIHESKNYKGTHGHLPSRVDMRSSLIIYGAGARAGAKMAVARMIDIAPSAAAILGLSFSDAEGVPIRNLIKPGMIPARPKKQGTKGN
jgi:predicted AlkP superfamily pyrophosphatase or phosphodiesterase